MQVTGSPKATLGAVAVDTKSYPLLDGGFTFTVKIPRDDSIVETYSIAATAGPSGNVATTAISIIEADTGKLASTGANLPVLVIWGGAGLRLLGMARMIVFTIVRRQRQQL